MCDKDSCNLDRLLRNLSKHCIVKERRYASGFVRAANSSANVWWFAVLPTAVPSANPGRYV